MITRIEIDPNVRTRGNQTYSGFEDVVGDLMIGAGVEVFESEASIVGFGRITDINVEHRLVYLAVDWSSLRVAPLVEPVQLFALASAPLSLGSSAGLAGNVVRLFDKLTSGVPSLAPAPLAVA